jgi:hypothetical protein
MAGAGRLRSGSELACPARAAARAAAGGAICRARIAILSGYLSDGPDGVRSGLEVSVAILVASAQRRTCIACRSTKCCYELLWVEQ